MNLEKTLVLTTIETMSKTLNSDSALMYVLEQLVEEHVVKCNEPDPVDMALGTVAVMLAMTRRREPEMTDYDDVYKQITEHIETVL